MNRSPISTPVAIELASLVFTGNKIDAAIRKGLKNCWVDNEPYFFRDEIWEAIWRDARDSLGMYAFNQVEIAYDQLRNGNRRAEFAQRQL